MATARLAAREANHADRVIALTPPPLFAGAGGAYVKSTAPVPGGCARDVAAV